jgi:lipid A disaccharide synthetase
MPGLLVDDPQVPELIQDQARPDILADKALELLDDSSAARRRIIEQYAEVRRVLTTEKGASLRVAEIVLEMCRPGRQH